MTKHFPKNLSARLASAIISALFISALPAAYAEDQAELIEMVLGFMTDEDKDIRSMAYEQIRTKAPGEEATKRFASELPKLPEPAQIGLLSALADRGDTAAKPAVTKLLNSALSSGESESLQIAAINAIGKLGDESDTATLIKLFSGEGEAAASARQSLVTLQGDGVSTAILAGASKAPGPLKSKLLDVLTTRRALDTIPELLKMAKVDDAETRAAAMKTLGQLAGPEHVAEIVPGVLAAVVGNERNNAEKNLMFVCNRNENKEDRAAPLLAAMEELSAEDRTVMIPSLGRIGGKAAFVEVDNALKSRDSKIHYMGIRAISNWPDATVAERLIKIAKTDKHADHQRIARMSILRIAPLPDGREDAEKLKLLQTGMKLAANEKERNYGIKRAAAIRLPETLRFVLPFLNQPKYSKQACQTVVELSHDRQLRDDNKEEFHAALDKVIAITKDEVLIDRANRYKNGQTWVKPD